MRPIEPTLGQLIALFKLCPQDRADRSLATLRQRTGPTPDPSEPEHCDEVLRWVNQWGCRIRRPRPGEPDTFARNLSAWWSAHAATLPTTALSETDEHDISLLADAYHALAHLPATHPIRTRASTAIRRFGPTAASKIMFVLRPDTVTPWDAAIARRTTGGTTRQHFVRHLTAARLWTTSTLDEAARVGIADIAAHVGRPNSSLAKIYDEWQYLTITRDAPVQSRPPRYGA